jgi:hypothetical protein
MSDVQAAMRAALLTLNDQVKPIHEWLTGQRQYFLSQGYTEPEARAMSAAEFVTVFGNSIHNSPAPD